MSEFNVILIFVVNEKVFENERFNVQKWTNSYVFFSFDKDAMTVSVLLN